MKDLILGLFLLVYDLLEDLFKFVFKSIQITRNDNIVKTFIKNNVGISVIIIGFIVAFILNLYFFAMHAFMIVCGLAILFFLIYKDIDADEAKGTLVLMGILYGIYLVIAYNISVFHYEKVGKINLTKNDIKEGKVEILKNGKSRTIYVKKCEPGEQQVFRETQTNNLFLNFEDNYVVKCHGKMLTYKELK